MITQTIRVNLNQKELETIQAVQSDTLREIAFEFYATDAEDAVQLDPDEFTVKFNMLKPDNNFVMSTFTDGIIKLTLNMTAVTGTGYYCIMLMDGDDVIYSGNGKIIINDHVIGTENIDSVSEANGYVFPDDFYTKNTPLAVLDDSSTSTTSTWSSNKINGEINTASTSAIAQLNAMKTGFDGVEYPSPAAMVQGEDQKLHDELYALVNPQTTVAHELLTTTTPIATYGNSCANGYVWIAKDIIIPAGSIAKIGVLTNNFAASYKLLILKKNSATNYTVVDTYSGTSLASGVKVDEYTVFATSDNLYIGLYSTDGAISFSSSNVGDNDHLVRNTYQAFIDGGGTATVSNVSSPLNFSFELTVIKAASASAEFPVCIVDQNGKGDYTTIQAAVNATNDGDTILIMPGTYFEQVKMWGKNRHLVGLSKENTIIASTNRYYNNEPLQANIGSVTNLTIIGGYGLTPIEGDTSSTSYAIHIEYANSSAFEFVVDNCNIISNVAPAIGMGVRYNQAVKIKNSLLQTKASQMWSSVYSEFFNIGGIFCHNDASGANLGTDGRIEVTDCELKGVVTALTLQSQNNGNTLTVRFVNDLLWSTENGKTNAVTIRTTPKEGHIAGSDVILDAMSFGNNIDTLNAS